MISKTSSSCKADRKAVYHMLQMTAIGYEPTQQVSQGKGLLRRMRHLHEVYVPAKSRLSSHRDIGKGVRKNQSERYCFLGSLTVERISPFPAIKRDRVKRIAAELFTSAMCPQFARLTR